MSTLRGKAPVTREKRLNAINAYYGAASALLGEFQQGEVRQRVRTFSQTALDDVTHVLSAVSGIDNAVAIIHGPRGCAAGYLYFSQQDEKNHVWAVTNLSERDTIMGGEEKLEQAIRVLNRRHAPQIIFVILTPAVAINNDDVLSVTEQLREELGIVIVPIYTDGFKSKTGITGYDSLFHALVKYLPSQPGGQGEHINLFSVSESDDERAELTTLLRELGIAVNVLPNAASLKHFLQAQHAKFSVGIHSDYVAYFGKITEEKFGVPFIETTIPVGLAGVEGWLKKIAQEFGLEKEAALLHKREVEKLQVVLQKPLLSGKKVYISLPSAQAAAVAALVQQLGGVVTGATVEHVDKLQEETIAKLTAVNAEFSLHVANGQLFEEVNILQKYRPDLYIGDAGKAGWAAQLGIPAVSVESFGLLGYQGVTRFISQTNKALQNAAFVKRLSKFAQLPYHNNWYGKSVNWYIKQEVK